MKAYFFLCESNDGWRNLAADEYFLNHIGKDEILLYIYINAPAVIIGKNQNAWRECNLKAMEADGVKLVRRISGGGAVYHDLGTVNFSFIAHKDIYDVPRQMNVILRAVRELGILAEFSGRNDLLAEGKKFSGNAFCVRGEGRQHHGTLLLSADLSKLPGYLNVSDEKLKSKGVSSVRSRVCNLCEFNAGITNEGMIEALKKGFAQEYGAFENWELGAAARQEIEALYEKQASWQWRLGQAPRFDLELKNRFDWGEIQVLLSFRQAHVSEVQVYSDALDTEIAEQLAQMLQGARFTAGDLAAAVLPEKKELAEIAGWLGSLEY